VAKISQSFTVFISGMQQQISDDPSPGFLSLQHNYRVILKVFWAKLQVSWLLGDS
jgi:hypothetical protein